ncbi:MAG: ATP-binding protein [Eubacteriales bacterium]|nr:ATP-binding protein [Eubacteriales bacterium]
MNTADVLNTPGYYYAIAYWFSIFVTVSTNKKRMTGWKLTAANGVCNLLLLAFMTLTDGIRQLLFIPSMAVIIGLIVLSIYICCDFTLREASYYCVKAFINGEFAASLCWQVYYHFARNLFTEHVQIWRWTEMILVYVLIFGCLYFFEKYLHKDVEELHITERELLVVIVIAAAVFGVSNMSYLDQNGLFSGRMAMDIYIIRTLVDMSGMAVLYAYHIQVKEVQMRFEKDTLQNIMEMQYKTYQLSQESIDIVNQKYHDLKHQIAILKAETDTEKSTGYLEQMEREIKIYETQNKTGNKVLDAVLTSKSLYCQNHGIELKFMVDGKLLFFMEDMDISALFGNMLDNAIESAQKQKDENKRLVGLYISKEKQFLRIRTENYCDEKIKFKNGMPITTKKDKHLHGYGMKSMQKTVEKYGGSVVAGQKNNWFELKILIPLEGK